MRKFEWCTFLMEFSQSVSFATLQLVTFPRPALCDRKLSNYRYFRLLFNSMKHERKYHSVTRLSCVHAHTHFLRGSDTALMFLIMLVNLTREYLLLCLIKFLTFCKLRTVPFIKNYCCPLNLKTAQNTCPQSQ